MSRVLAARSLVILTDLETVVNRDTKAEPLCTQEKKKEAKPRPSLPLSAPLIAIDPLRPLIDGVHSNLIELAILHLLARSSRFNQLKIK
jgi:hypothetical protein